MTARGQPGNLVRHPDSRLCCPPISCAPQLSPELHLSGTRPSCFLLLLLPTLSPPAIHFNTRRASHCSADLDSAGLPQPRQFLETPQSATTTSPAQLSDLPAHLTPRRHSSRSLETRRRDRRSLPCSRPLFAHPRSTSAAATASP